jgi:phosphoribosylamine--glycine ligase
MASQGYPDAYEKGFEIQGFEKAKQSGAIVFHAGTVLKSGKVVSAGGRVLDVTALGTSLKEAARNVYRGVSEIHFKNAFYRSDIAKRIYERSVKV